jgi:catechol 2,3-dioxygenase-like lactoylglutathione lyase family enzyme
MKIRHVSTIVLVSDVDRSRAFYRDLLAQTVVADHGTIVMFEGGLVIHDGVNLLERTYRTPGAFPAGPRGKDSLDVYFETDELDHVYRLVCESGAAIIHGIEVQSWGQRVFRFHDPDGHIVEIGDPM